MKKIVSALIQRPRSPRASVARAQSSHITLCTPPKSVSNSSPEAKRSRPEPANPQPDPFFSRWLDTWRTQNGGPRQ
jgi:hypothetical protein